MIPDLTITVANDTSDTILDSLKDVAETMVLAVIISMFIIFLFFGDYKGVPDRRKFDSDFDFDVLDCDHDGRIFVERYHDECAGTRRRHDGR